MINAISLMNYYLIFSILHVTFKKKTKQTNETKKKQTNKQTKQKKQETNKQTNKKTIKNI